MTDPAEPELSDEAVESVARIIGLILPPEDDGSRDCRCSVIATAIIENFLPHLTTQQVLPGEGDGLLRQSSFLPPSAVSPLAPTDGIEPGHGELEEMDREEVADLRSRVATLTQAILDIDAHAVALGEDKDGWAAVGYFVSIGALHRALGVVGHPAAKDKGYVEMRHYVTQKTENILWTVIRHHHKGVPHGEGGLPRCTFDDEVWPCSFLLGLRTILGEHLDAQ